MLKITKIPTFICSLTLTATSVKSQQNAVEKNLIWLIGFFFFKEIKEHTQQKTDEEKIFEMGDTPENRRKF